MILEYHYPTIRIQINPEQLHNVQVVANLCKGEIMNITPSPFTVHVQFDNEEDKNKAQKLLAYYRA